MFFNFILYLWAWFTTYDTYAFLKVALSLETYFVYACILVVQLCRKSEDLFLQSRYLYLKLQKAKNAKSFVCTYVCMHDCASLRKASGASLRFSWGLFSLWSFVYVFQSCIAVLLILIRFLISRYVHCTGFKSDRSVYDPVEQFNYVPVKHNYMLQPDFKFGQNYSHFATYCKLWILKWRPH